MIKSIVSGANTVWRRSGGKLGWRQQDLEGLLAYWASTNAQARDGKSGDWRLYFASQDALHIAAYPKICFKVANRKRDVTSRYDAEVGPILLKRSRRNLHRVARVVGAEAYAPEYARDLLECSIERSDTFVAGDVLERVPIEVITRNEEYLVERVHTLMNAGYGGWRDQDAFAKEVAVGYLFAGSERVARAYVRDHGIGISVPEGLRDIVERGLKQLAGEPCQFSPLSAGYYVCAERYWSHIERVLQGGGFSNVQHRAVGRYLAAICLSKGEWI
jgi:hypothetical protein